MTQAKAQTVASALIGLGYVVTAQKLADNSYVLRAQGGDIDPAAVTTFATAQSIIATVAVVTFT